MRRPSWSFKRCCNHHDHAGETRDRDTLAPVEDARLFVEMLRDVSKAPVFYAELLGAQHAFDLFASPRTAAMLSGTLRFLTAMRGKVEATVEVQSSYTSAMGNVTSPPS